MVKDLPFEGRKVERSWKYRRRERVSKAGSRREETITVHFLTLTNMWKKTKAAEEEGDLSLHYIHILNIFLFLLPIGKFTTRPYGW